jgi:5'-nucleotidase
VGSGSIRAKELGPVVTLGDLTACFPFKDTVQKFTVSGDALKRMFSKFMSNENRRLQGECYQVSKGAKAIYDKTLDKLVSLSLNGEEIVDDKQYSVCLQGFHYLNLKKFLDVDEGEISNYKLIATAQTDIIEEYLRAHQMLNSKVEGRLTYIG